MTHLLALLLLTVLRSVSPASLEVTPSALYEWLETCGSDEWVFVKVYASWCAHCEHIAPHFEALSEELADSSAGSKIRFVSLELSKDDEVHAKARKQLEVDAFPTLLVFGCESKTMSKFEGHERTKQAMQTFIIDETERDEGRSGKRTFRISKSGLILQKPKVRMRMKKWMEKFAHVTLSLLTKYPDVVFAYVGVGAAFGSSAATVCFLLASLRRRSEKTRIEDTAVAEEEKKEK